MLDYNKGSYTFIKKKRKKIEDLKPRNMVKFSSCVGIILIFLVFIYNGYD